MGNLASVVDELLVADVRDQPDQAIAEELVELRRQINRLESAYLTRLEVFDRRGAATDTAGTTAAWLRQSVRLSPAAASRDVHLARDLADMLPATAAALADGEISPAHAQVIASVHPTLTAEVTRTVDPHLAEAARTHTPIELRGWVTHVKHAYGRDHVDADERDDYANRSLHAATTIHGIGVGSWTLHPLGHELVMTALHAASRPVVGDDRTAAQRRADALITVAEIALRSGELPITGGVKPHGTVIVPLATLQQRAGAPAADTSFGATLTGETARRLLCDADISRIITGPAGEILDAGRATRTFTAAMIRAIVARDRHCIWPGCDTPPGWCDVHHRVHWADGGESSVNNGVLACGRHHDRIHTHHHAITNTGGRYTIDLRPGSASTHSNHQRAGP